MVSLNLVSLIIPGIPHHPTLCHGPGDLVADGPVTLFPTSATVTPTDRPLLSPPEPLWPLHCSVQLHTQALPTCSLLQGKRDASAVSILLPVQALVSPQLRTGPSLWEWRHSSVSVLCRIFLDKGSSGPEEILCMQVCLMPAGNPAVTFLAIHSIPIISNLVPTTHLSTFSRMFGIWLSSTVVRALSWLATWQALELEPWRLCVSVVEFPEE